MDYDAILEWSDRYDEVFDGELREIEDHLNQTIREQQYITQEQLEDVIRWKLDGQPGRRDRNIEAMQRVPDAFVRQISEAALSVSDPKTQLKTLSSIPGIGAATATVILAFADPTNYAVGDRYIVDALLGEDRSLRITDYPRILDEFRERNPGGFDLRTVEKAYYQRHRVENDISR